MMDAVGELDPAVVTEALRRAMAAHPATTARLGTSTWRALPVWRCDTDGVSPQYSQFDVSHESDWRAAANRLSEQRFSAGWNLDDPPQVRLEHYRGPERQHRLCLRWPHALMDAAGAQHFLCEMNRLSADESSPLPNHLLPDEQPCCPLDGLGAWRRLRYTWQGLRARSSHLSQPRDTLCDTLADRPASSRRLRFCEQSWSPAMVERMRELAAAVAPPGPALYGRYLAGCVLRAVDLLHAEQGRQLDYHGLMFPLHVVGMERRAVPGNLLAAIALEIAPQRIADRRAVAEDIYEQFRDGLTRRADLASWALQAWAAKLRTSQYRRLIERQTHTQPFVTGFSFSGDIQPPLRRFLGAEVTNLWGAGVVSIPPGLNPVFTKFGRRMTLALSWPDGSYPECVAVRYAELIAQQALEP